jgi:fumarylacetoacetate (FAA) hydrolase
MHLLFGDTLKGPCAPLQGASREQVPDFEAGIAVVTGDVAPAASAGQALDAVRLLMLVSHVQLRALQDDLTQMLAAAPCSVFSPVAVTPDEMVWGGETAWMQGRLNLTLQCHVNGRKLGLCDAGSDMVVPFGELISNLSQTREVRAGSIFSSGEVRNLESSRGCCSMAARRAQEAAQNGTSSTPWLTQGDQLLIDMKGRDGQSVFGAIEQQVHIGPQPIPVAP